MAIIQSGELLSTGANINVVLPGDADWMWVYNLTQAGATNNAGVQFYWQRGMNAGTGIEVAKFGGGNALEMVVTATGFTPFDTSVYTTGNPVATTASTNAAQPVIDTATTTGLLTGSIVRLSNITAVPTICGIDFEIFNVVASTSFEVRWPLANAPGAVGGAGFYRVIPNPQQFAPQRLFVANIQSVGATTVVTTTVTHGYVPGEEVRMYVPSAANGMVQIDGLQGTILSVNLTNNTFTLDIDSSGFTPFVWPNAAASPYTPAQCMAFGDNTSAYLTFVPPTDYLADATANIATIGITLAGGINGPAGQNADVLFYVAGKSDQDNS